MSEQRHMAVGPERENFLAEIVSLERELRRYIGTLCRRTPDEINDVVNETYLRVLVTPDWHKYASPAALLKRVARNLFFDSLKRRKTSENYVAAQVWIDATHGGGVVALDDIIAEQERVERLLDVVDALPKKQREILLLRGWDGLSHQSIAEKMGLSVSTVEKHVSRALNHLRNDGEGVSAG